MPTRAPQHRPKGWSPTPPAPRVRTRDEHERSYGTAAWRKLAAATLQRFGGQCFVCGKPGATIAHHLVERRQGGTDAPHNLVAVHHACHERLHKRGRSA